MTGLFAPTRVTDYRAASSRAAKAGLLFSLAAGNLAAQPASTFAPTRCARDTTTVLTLPASVSTVDTVAPGIRYQCLYSPSGPWAIHVVSIDLATRRYAVEGARALGAMLGREKVSDMTQRLRARGDTPVVAINADFFNLRTGEVANNTVIRGEWVKGVVIRDAPHTEVDNARTQFAVDDRGRPLMGRFELHGEVHAGAVRERLLGINYRSARDTGLVLYTPWFGERTPVDSSAPEAVDVILDRIQAAEGQAVYRVRRGSLTSGGGTAIPARGAVLRGNGAAVTLLRQLQRHAGTVRITLRLGAHPSSPHTVVGGWPRLVVDGSNVGALADSLEGTRPGFSLARHPRSAIGISRDSSTLMLVVVDGRRPWSAGMSLAELGAQLIALGAYQAMNLDGGGSSTLWVRGTIVNYPSDPTGERPVGNALMIVPRR